MRIPALLMTGQKSPFPHLAEASSTLDLGERSLSHEVHSSCTLETKQGYLREAGGTKREAVQETSKNKEEVKFMDSKP